MDYPTKIIYCVDTNETYYSYDDFIKSKHWKNLREEFKKSIFCKNKCFICGTIKDLELHHKSYKTLGNEGLNDLVELCIPCHGAVHSKMHKDVTNDQAEEILNNLRQDFPHKKLDNYKTRNKDYFIYTLPSEVITRKATKEELKKHEAPCNRLLQVFVINSYNKKDILKKRLYRFIDFTREGKGWVNQIKGTLKGWVKEIREDRLEEELKFLKEIGIGKHNLKILNEENFIYDDLYQNNNY